MSEPFYRLLKQFIWPRYYEEGPPSYIDMAFLGKDVGADGELKEPLKSVLDLIVIGYRPVTSLSIFSALVENENKPMYGSQIGAELEEKFQLPKGWFTKTRYYDNRIGRLLKIFLRQGILKEMKVKDWKTRKEYVGYRIAEKLYPTVKEGILSLHRGESLSILSPSITSNVAIKKPEKAKNCSQCNTSTDSPLARYCELCGTALKTKCPNCGEETSLEYLFCLNCGKRI
jgi:hypothetical protein